MKLSELTYAKKAKKKPKRVGRGSGSGYGKTCGRGANGQLSRSGHKKRSWFEGGQMPIQRRVPKRGFTNIFRKEYQIVNLQDLNRLQDEEQITPEILHKKKVISKKNMPVKILGEGEWENPTNISAHAFSKSAIQKIENAGGKAIIL